MSAKFSGIVSQIVRRPTGLCCRVLGTVFLFLNLGLCLIQSASPQSQKLSNVPTGVTVVNWLSHKVTATSTPQIIDNTEEIY